MKQDDNIMAIIGGIGPDASARLVARTVELSRELAGAQNSDDYPHFLMENVPVPDFFDNPDLYKAGLAMLKQSVRRLSVLKPACIAMACNTVHALLPQLQRETDVPMVDLPFEVAKVVRRAGYKRVGLLATPFTYNSRIYEKAFENDGIGVLVPGNAEIDAIAGVIHLILSGKFDEGRAALVAVADRLVEQGAQAIVLGCTELPLVFPKNYVVPTVSSLECLAQKLVCDYYDIKQGEL